MKFRILCLAFLLTGLASAVSAQNASTDLERFNRELKAKSTSIETISCSFKQTRSVAVLASDVVKEGRFYYSRPENILLDFEDGDYIRMTETLFQIRNGGKVNKVKVSSNPFMKELSRILTSCMIGDMDQILTAFTYELSYGDAQYTLSLSPKKNRASGKISKVVIVFEEGNMSLSELRMEEYSGDYTQYLFFNKEFNTELSPELFETK